MSSKEVLGKDPAPSALRYLVLFSFIFSLVTMLAFIIDIAGEGTIEQRLLGELTQGFAIISVLTLIEYFVLRRNRKIAGSYGYSLALEAIKVYYIAVMTTRYANVMHKSTTSFDLLLYTSLVTIGTLLITKFARPQIEELAAKDISRNVLNLLPSMIVIILFLGSYVTEIVGLGTPRHINNAEEWTNSPFDLSLFNTPTWDATYLLENLLDQFTAGLSSGDTPIFNISSNKYDSSGGVPISDSKNPPSYWKLGTLSSYVFKNRAPYTTDWVASTALKTEMDPDPSSTTTYSQEVPDTIPGEIGYADENFLNSYEKYNFNIRMPINRSTINGQISAHPSYANYLPLPWNGEFGSYVSSDSFKYYEQPTSLSWDNNRDWKASGNQISPSSQLVNEFGVNYPIEDATGVEIQTQFTEGDTSNEDAIFEYSVEALKPDFMYTLYSLFSLGRDDYESVLGTSEWDAVNYLYNQLPNQTTTGFSWPSQFPEDYADWAPQVDELANMIKQEELSVFGQAYELMRYMGNGSMFTFDLEMWLSNQLNVNMEHPEEYSDYNNWFLNRVDEDSGKIKGVSLHFASTYATVMRLLGIPSRVAIGYLAGNSTVADNNVETVMTSRFLHAWPEVLVPVDPTPTREIDDDEYAAWVTFDPLLILFANDPSLLGDIQLSLTDLFNQPPYYHKLLDPSFILGAQNVTSTDFTAFEIGAISALVNLSGPAEFRLFDTVDVQISDTTDTPISEEGLVTQEPYISHPNGEGYKNILDQFYVTLTSQLVTVVSLAMPPVPIFNLPEPLPNIRILTGTLQSNGTFLMVEIDTIPLGENGFINYHTLVDLFLWTIDDDVLFYFEVEEIPDFAVMQGYSIFSYNFILF